MSLVRGVLIGAAAGAAGTTALNAVTYLDMVARGRPTSSTPEATVEKLADKAHVPVPGEGDARQNRVAGLGPLTGLVAGVGVGAGLGVGRAAGWASRPGGQRPARHRGRLDRQQRADDGAGRVTDPRTWAATDWVADVVPHVVYGAVTAWVLRGLDQHP